MAVAVEAGDDDSRQSAHRVNLASAPERVKLVGLGAASDWASYWRSVRRLG